jgi:hypothetical protein
MVNKIKINKKKKISHSATRLKIMGISTIQMLTFEYTEDHAQKEPSGVLNEMKPLQK